jgi:hypothetical protein
LGAIIISGDDRGAGPENDDAGAAAALAGGTAAVELPDAEQNQAPDAAIR